MTDMNVTITLDFMQRDTVLAILKDMIGIKNKLAEMAITGEEERYCKKHAEIAKELYDIIYEQKLEEFKSAVK